jgi:hypothetical protein
LGLQVVWNSDKSNIMGNPLILDLGLPTAFLWRY